MTTVRIHSILTNIGDCKVILNLGSSFGVAFVSISIDEVVVVEVGTRVAIPLVAISNILSIVSFFNEPHSLIRNNK